MCEIDKFGNKRWYNKNRQLHRENGLPALERADGGKVWHVNGMDHRLGGLPSLEYISGYKAWWEYGKRHRLGGLPAVEFNNLHDFFGCWIYGKQYTQQKVINSYKILARFGRLCLKNIRLNKIKRAKNIHNELLCMPPNTINNSYPGGKDYHKMKNYFNNL